ncbi:translational activator GCN1 [Auriculariales sp. MPI-PUGE-AT-0066]|nr:translational activator GCN1 [Auriculariales sp. MPI-PUGE-AT-0066]
MDVKIWAAGVHDDDDEHFEGPSLLSWDGDAKLWPDLLEFAQLRLLESSTRLRTEFLDAQLLPFVEKGPAPSQLADVFRILTMTYPRYIDFPSRTGAEKVLCALLRAHEDLRTKIVQWLLRETERVAAIADSTAAGNQYALFCWLGAAYPHVVDTPSMPVLVGAMAVLYDALLDKARNVKHTMRRSVIVHARRSVRNVCLGTLAYIPFIGLVADVVLHLKHKKDVPTEALEKNVPAIVALYANSVLMSRTAVPKHASTALDGFIGTLVTSQTFAADILPVMEKAMLRSPEVALAVRILNPILNTAKSTNTGARADAVRLYGALPSTSGGTAQDEILSTLRGGKTGGADHRATLYAMLAYARPSTGEESVRFVTELLALLPKESSDANAPLLVRLAAPHARAALQADRPLDAAVWVKEVTNGRPAVRKALVEVLGDIFWTIEGESGASTQFAEALAPALAALATKSDPAAQLETYVAFAVLLGRGALQAVWAKHAPALTVVLGTPAKPGYLVLEKIYTKLTTVEEERWLLRALQASITAFEKDLEAKSASPLRQYLGSALLYLALSSPRLETRRLAIDTIRTSVSTVPRATSTTLREALARVVNTSDGRRYAPILSASSPVTAEDSDPELREELVVELLILAHDTGICKDSQMWTDLVLRAGLDPRAVAERHLDRLVEMVLETVPATDAHFAAVTTLTGIQPMLFLPKFIGRIQSTLEPALLRRVTEEDLQIWRTPEGELCIDILAAKKGGSGANAPKKGKDADMLRWDAELRDSLAKKKSSGAPAALTANLSKADKALVDAQLAREQDVRARVTGVRATLERGLALLSCVVRAGVPETQPFLGVLAELMLAPGGVLRRGYLLVGVKAATTYLDITEATESRLGTFKQALGVATLRALEIPDLPEEHTVEPLNGLLLRVLYRLRSLSERQPFEPATLTLASIMTSAVATAGGLGSSDSEEALEQVALVVDIFSFHTTAFAEPAYPRLSAFKSLVQVVKKHPQLAKNAVSALITAGESASRSADASSADVRYLLACLLEQETSVRHSCLLALQPFDLTELDWCKEIWIACQDEDEGVARLAEQLWEDNGLDVSETFAVDLLPLLEHDNAYVRTATAAAIAKGAQSWPSGVEQLLDALKAFYRDKVTLLEPQFDAYGLLVEESLNRQDQWPTRKAVAAAFEGLAPTMTETDVLPFFQFLVNEEALGDRHADVRRDLLTAGNAVIDLYGKPCLPDLIKLFEGRLEQKTHTDAGDQVHEAVVVLLGRVARHLDPADSRIPQVVRRLVDTLKTPVEQVQIAVSDCMAPLMKFMKLTANSLIEELLQQLFTAPKYAERRGAAYGIAGVVRGLGIASIPKYDLLTRLQSKLEDKKNSEARQGAMFAYETLPSTLGRLFEPYVVGLVPNLLAAFGDPQADVREATQDAAKVIMSGLSGYGVKLILPSLLEALDEKQWRTKKAAIELLGSMAYLAPTQLSVSLPTVIPRLTGVLTDSHAQVRTAANKSLKQFGEVISNPEIQQLVPVLLKAFVDPEKTAPALSSLLKTTFAHYIDSSSLALVIPIVERGMKERGAETKKKAAQIVGNMASLTDAKDFIPYIPRLLPLVHTVLSDPVPEARATAAKALGSLVERLGEDRFPDLIQNLFSTLKKDIPGRMEGLLPEIIDNATSPRSYVREGFMSLLVFLPATFGARFHPHLPKIIPPILSGLADREEHVREASMKAGRMIINNYATRAVDLLLPELERSMFDDGWRIRHSSVTLVGELLFKISGISGKAEIEEDEGTADMAVETSRAALVETLGKERRDRVLASLYLVRQDTVNAVRQSAIHIWKALVQNTPRTVRDILPSLMSQVVELLASDGVDQRETAARTIGELCKKFGERILRDIMPILNNSAQSPDARVREGVCIALSEVMVNASENQRDDHENDIIAIVRNSLVDENASVRTAAARAFDVLQDTIGDNAIHATIPTLLAALRQPGASSGTALQALREVMAVRASEVFPLLIPVLTSPPITAFNARALSSLVSVAGTALNNRLKKLLQSVLQARETETDEEISEELDEALSAIVGAIEDSEGLNILMMALLEWAKDHNPKRRASAFTLFGTFCAVTEVDFSLYRIDWVRQLIASLDDPIPDVIDAAWVALDAFIKAVPKDELEGLVPSLRRAIEGVGAPGRTVPGFAVHKGIGPLVPVLVAGLTTGSSEQREAAATAMGELVARTDEASLKPFVVPFTGPLIRVGTQAGAFPPAVRGAIVGALGSMVERIPALVRSFFPQLQRTFVKAASDPISLAVRSKAVDALGALVRHQARVDPLVTELVGSVRSARDAGDEAVAASLVNAIASVAKNSGSNLGQASKDICIELLRDGLRDGGDEYYTQGIASLFAGLLRFPDILQPVVESYILTGPLSVAVSQTLLTSLTDDPELFFSAALRATDVARRVMACIADDRPSVSRPCREARDTLRNSAPWCEDDAVRAIVG